MCVVMTILQMFFNPAKKNKAENFARREMNTRTHQIVERCRKALSHVSLKWIIEEELGDCRIYEAHRAQRQWRGECAVTRRGRVCACVCVAACACVWRRQYQERTWRVVAGRAAVPVTAWCPELRWGTGSDDRAAKHLAYNERVPSRQPSLCRAVAQAR